jgi:hypothetical protein
MVFPNVEVDATGPGTSLGTDADGAPRTCGDLPALPGCIPRLVRSPAARRIATGCRTPGLYQNAPEAQAESSETPGNITSSRGWRTLRPRRIRMALTPARHIHHADHGHKPTKSNHPALADGGHSDREQIIRSRSGISLRPGASRIGMMTTIKPPDIYPDRPQYPDRTTFRQKNGIRQKIDSV